MNRASSLIPLQYPHPSSGGLSPSLVVTGQADPWSGTPCGTPSSSLTGLVAPSVLLSFRGGSLLLLLLVDAICLPRPGALASTSPASTPLSSLSVCPLSESCESVEAAGRGEQEESGIYTAGVRESFLEEVMKLQTDRLGGWEGSWRAGRFSTTLPPTETRPSHWACPRGCRS